MYLIVNCITKQKWQQKELAIDDPIRDHPNFLCFQAREIPLYRDKPLEMCFEVACNSLTGWDELPIFNSNRLEEITKDLEKMGVPPEEIKQLIATDYGDPSQ